MHDSRPFDPSAVALPIRKKKRAANTRKIISPATMSALSACVGYFICPPVENGFWVSPESDVFSLVMSSASRRSSMRFASLPL